MRFKVGDKIRTVKEFADNGGGERLLPIGTIGTIGTIVGVNPCGRSPYLVRANNEVRYLYQEDMLEPYEEKTYEQGLADAWELARKIVLDKDGGGFSCSELESIFDTVYPSDILEQFTYEEALAKVKAYEDRTKIAPNKIVEDNEGTRALVLDDYGEGVYFVLTENGCVENWQRERCVAVREKTIDVSELAKQIGER